MKIREKNLILLKLCLIILLVMTLGIYYCSPSYIDIGDGYGDDDDYYGDDDDGDDDGYGDDYEFDNTYSDATLIQPDNKIQYHTLHSRTDVDYVKFYGTDNTDYIIKLVDIDGFEPELSVFDSDNILIEMKSTSTYTGDFDWWGYDKDRNKSAEEIEAIVLQVKKSAYYYIRIKDIYNSNDGQASYGISVNTAPNIPATVLTSTSNISDLSINISWDKVENSTGYKLYRSNIEQNLTNPNYDDFELILDTNEILFTDENLSLNETFYYFVKVYMGKRESSESNIEKVSVIIDAPTELSTSYNLANRSITLQWNEATGVDGYKIYRTETAQDLTNPTETDFSIIGTVSELTYTDTQCEIATKYYYFVKSYIDSNESGSSNISDETITINTPTNLSYSDNLTDNSLILEWDEVTGVDGYKIYRTETAQDLTNPTETDFSIIGTVSELTYTDTQRDKQKKYYYFVKGYIDSNESDSSNIVFVIDAVKNTLSEADSQDFEINITWDSVTDAESYKLFRTKITQDINSPNYSDFTLISDSIETNSYTDSNIEPDVTYYYYVIASANSKDSLPSNVDDVIFNWQDFSPTSALITASEDAQQKILITLEKKYQYSNIVRYDVYRAADTSSDPATFTLIGSFNGNADVSSTIDDTNVTPGTYYFYCVRIIININEQEFLSDYSKFDSGIANN